MGTVRKRLHNFAKTGIILKTSQNPLSLTAITWAITINHVSSFHTFDVLPLRSIHIPDMPCSGQHAMCLSHFLLASFTIFSPWKESFSQRVHFSNTNQPIQAPHSQPTSFLGSHTSGHYLPASLLQVFNNEGQPLVPWANPKPASSASSIPSQNPQRFLHTVPQPSPWPPPVLPQVVPHGMPSPPRNCKELPL